MIQTGIAATTLKDAHGDKLTKNCLQHMADDINHSKFATGAGLDHDLLASPIGKTISGKVVPLGDGEFGLEITQEIFENYEIVALANKEQYVKSSSLTDTRPYASLFHDSCDWLSVAVGQVNFSQEGYEQFYKSLDDTVKLEANMRKSLIPDPEIIFSVAVGLLLRDVAEGIGHKVSEDLVSLYGVIKRTILDYGNCILPNQQIPVYAFQTKYHDIEVQMVVKSKVLDLMMSSISQESLQEVRAIIDDIRFQLQPHLMQFSFDTVEKRWKITHFSTENGVVFGTKETFRYTKNLLSKYQTAQRLNLDLAPRNVGDN